MAGGMRWDCTPAQEAASRPMAVPGREVQSEKFIAERA